MDLRQLVQESLGGTHTIEQRADPEMLPKVAEVRTRMERLRTLPR
jgi:hypothetical protein